MTNQDARVAEAVGLTVREREILQALQDGQTLDRATPGGWWLGNNQVDGRVGWSLMRKHLITTEDEDDTIEVFRISENGRKALLAIQEERDENS